MISPEVGEGSIHVLPDLRRGEGVYNTMVRIKMNHEETILHLKTLFGGSLIPQPSKNPKHNDGFLLLWTGSEAKELLIKIFTKLITERKQAMFFICFPFEVGKRPSAEEKQQRLQIYVEMKELNLRGRKK